MSQFLPSSWGLERGSFDELTLTFISKTLYDKPLIDELQTAHRIINTKDGRKWKDCMQQLMLMKSSINLFFWIHDKQSRRYTLKIASMPEPEGHLCF